MAQATKPTTRAASFVGTWQEMRDELIALRAEVGKLRAENASLKSAKDAPQPPSQEKYKDDYAALMNSTRTREIVRLNQKIADAEPQLKKLKRGTYPYEHLGIWLGYWKKRLAMYQAGALPRDVEMSADGELSVGMVGAIHEFELVQIVGNSDAIANALLTRDVKEKVIGGNVAMESVTVQRLVWLRGVDISKKADGQNLQTPGQVFAVTGTKRYETASGTNTVMMVEPIR